MFKPTKKQQKIIEIFLAKEKMQSSELHKELEISGEDISLVTVKRALSELTEKSILEVSGSGRSTSYGLSVSGRVLADVKAKQYVAIEPDKRYGSNQYNFNLFSNFPSDIFTEEELEKLETATVKYKKRTTDLSSVIQKKELERLVIELSWKSSKIEGNAYTLLDTEKLLLENKIAPGYSKNETQMILNHKDAFIYIRTHSSQFQTITRKNLEELHSVLVKDLNVNLGFRSRAVGITGSIYRPLDNVYQITEAVEALSKTVFKSETPYAKALLALLGISYIQPFEDGNKRTARLMTNALLISHSLAPLSYRSVDEEEYKSAVLTFYELNSIVPMKKIFIDQYEFASENYAVK
ncbi:MAG: Fic family protein [Patescibacteria group bacterium]|nr:Fic family protein [Patescibacteria group bacterium]MBU1870511.1 Fic family protein [Patescibacteria group bacterium]